MNAKHQRTKSKARIAAGLSLTTLAGLALATVAGQSIVANAESRPAADVTTDPPVTATDQVTVTVLNSGLTLKKSSNRATIVKGQRVTFTYLGSSVGDTGVSYKEVQVEDDKCSPVTFVSGDTNSDQLLNPGETWQWTCSQTLTQTTTNIGKIQGVPVLTGGSPSGTPTGTPSPTATGTPSPTASGTLKDGTYTGAPASITIPEVPGEVYTDTVTIVVTSGKISNVTAALSTIPNRTSAFLASDANTTLIAQAIANNGIVSNVSGATYTAVGFKASLQSAITQAGG